MQKIYFNIRKKEVNIAAIHVISYKISYMYCARYK